MRVATRTGIACPPERVFDLVADMRNEIQWNRRVSSAELHSAEPVGQDSRFAVVNSGTTYEVTITTFERPSRLVFEARGNPDLGIEYAFTPNGAGTDFASELDFRPRGVSKVVFALLAPVIRRDVRKQYAALKALCER
jgi:hypothetical protein